jgi:predicted Zn-dependent peptidase
MPGVRSVAVGAWIGVGSRFERPDQSGVSHFLEHLLFKGTPDRSAEVIAQTFDGLGGEVNAATGKDYTVVYARVLDEHLEQALPVLADMLQHPVFADLDQEREVVLEEIAMYEDDPQDRVHDLLAEAVFPDQALGRPVIGAAEVIGSVSRDALRAYHAGFYAAPNVVLAAAGSLDHDRLVELLDRHLGDLPRDGGPAVFEPAAPGGSRTLVQEKPTEQYHLCFGGPGVSRTDPRRHAQGVLDTILGGSMSSRLFQEVRERRGLAYSIGTYTVSYADTGQVGVFLGTREDNLAEVCDIVARELRRIAEEPVPDDELLRAKDHIKGRLVLGLESSSHRMNRIGRILLTGIELLSIDEIIGRIDAVTPEDVGALAREFWQPPSLSLAAIGPSGEAVHTAVDSGFAHLAA